MKTPIQEETYTKYSVLVLFKHSALIISIIKKYFLNVLLNQYRDIITL
jgi:hypothetical protein